MYGSVVKGLDRVELEKKMEGTSVGLGLQYYSEKTGQQFPGSFDQLMGAIEAVFKSWDNERALVYRKAQNIPREWGTAVTIQAMVFGNLNDQSGTGVLFTRNADTGEATITGEFLINAQGEDVVAGIRTPLPLSEMVKWNATATHELFPIVKNLEKLKKDVQDVEFTVQDGELFILQTRNAKRTPQAAVRIAYDMLQEGLIDVQTAIKRVDLRTLDLAEVAVIDPTYKTPATFKGIAACSGVVTGIPVFSSTAAINCKEPCILVTKETTPDDLEGMMASVGVITMEGGLTSHAAVVARGFNKPCITGVGIDLAEFMKKLPVPSALHHSYGQISMDGSTGNIWMEAVPIIAGNNKYVKAFKDVVCQKLDIVPVIHDVPEDYLKSAVLEMKNNLFSTAEAIELVKKVLTKVNHLYLDFLMDETEEKFYSIFRIKTFQDAFIAALNKDPQKKLLKTNLTLIGAKTAQYKVLGSIAEGLESVILATEEIVVGDLSGNPALEWVVKHKKEEGVKMVSVGSYAPGVKSLTSFEKAVAQTVAQKE
jgi:pyruvate,phosphate dikinase